jgi:hypothetical protein
MPFMGDRSIIKPPSQTAFPAKLWPPPRTEIRTFLVTREIDAGNHVLGLGTSRDQRRAFVDHAVPNATCGVVFRVGRREKRADEPPLQVPNCCSCEHVVSLGYVLQPTTDHDRITLVPRLSRTVGRGD